MDNKKIRKIEIWGAVFGILFGSALHFTFQWSGENIFVGLFSAVNESVWEHTKLVFFPILIFGFVEMYFIRDYKRLCFAKVVESVFTITFIITFFYTYTGIFGIESLAIDIASFIVAVILGKYISYKILISNKKLKVPKVISAALFVLILLGFIAFTFNPPRIPLFKDSQENTYGIYKNH